MVLQNTWALITFPSHNLSSDIKGFLYCKKVVKKYVFFLWQQWIILSQLKHVLRFLKDCFSTFLLDYYIVRPKCPVKLCLSKWVCFPPPQKNRLYISNIKCLKEDYHNVNSNVSKHSTNHAYSFKLHAVKYLFSYK